MSFTDANLVASVFTFDHNLNVLYPLIEVFDNSDNIIVPDEVTSVDLNTVTIDLSSFAPITGTWNTSAAGGAFDANILAGDFVRNSVFNSSFNSDFNLNNVIRLLQNSVYSAGASLTLEPDTNKFNVNDSNLTIAPSQIPDLNNATVAQIIAGTNITISPTNGIGVVTINSTSIGGGGGFYFPGASLTLSDGNFFNVNDANLALTFYTQTDANTNFVRLNPLANQTISDFNLTVLNDTNSLRFCLSDDCISEWDEIILEVDGGFANSVYLPIQNIDGGNAFNE